MQKCKTVNRLQIAFKETSLFQSSLVAINATLYQYEVLLSYANYYHIQNSFENSSTYGSLFSEILFENPCDHINMSASDYASCLHDNTSGTALMSIELIYLNDMRSLYLQLLDSNNTEELLNDGTISLYISRFMSASSENPFVRLVDELELFILAEYTLLYRLDYLQKIVMGIIISELVWCLVSFYTIWKVLYNDYSAKYNSMKSILL